MRPFKSSESKPSVRPENKADMQSKKTTIMYAIHAGFIVKLSASSIFAVGDIVGNTHPGSVLTISGCDAEANVERIKAPRFTLAKTERQVSIVSALEVSSAKTTESLD